MPSHQDLGGLSPSALTLEVRLFLLLSKILHFQTFPHICHVECFCHVWFLFCAEFKVLIIICRGKSLGLFCLAAT